MPLGYRSFGPAVGPSFTPAILRGITSPAAATATASGAAPAGTLEHYEIQPGDLAGSAVVTLSTGPGDRIVVLERDGIEMRLSFDGAALTAANYDLLHPGKGELDRGWPTYRKVSILAASNPTSIVDVWVLGGVYALRPT